jgi:hypothetical protein
VHTVPALRTACDLVGASTPWVRSKASADLDAWLSDAADSLLGSFASGIAGDKDAVEAAITEP